MSSSPEADETLKRTTRSSGYDVESLLAPSAPSTSYAQNTSPKLTAKVVPFALRENHSGPMEPTVPHQDNSFQKVSSNQQLFPMVGYPVPSPLTLANLQLYSLWSHANMMNWPLMGNPALTQPIRPAKTEAQIRPSNINVTRTVRSEENPPSNDSSLNSNSATESLFAASECHLAVLRDDDGDTPLHIAIVHENHRLIQKLIGLITFSRLTVDTPNNLSQTPLHIAVLTNQSWIVQKLINAGGDANAQDRNGQTPVHIAAEKCYIACLAEILVGSRNKSSRNKSANLEIRNFEGFTALHVAVRKQHKSVIEALIQYGANVNAKDGKSGHTPLHHAIDYESCEVLQLLVTKGANVNKANYSGITPVQSANCCRNEAVSKILVSQETAAAIGPVKFKMTSTTSTTATTSTYPNGAKNTDSRTETMKRSIESPPSSSKRPRVNDDK